MLRFNLVVRAVRTDPSRRPVALYCNRREGETAAGKLKAHLHGAKLVLWANTPGLLG